MGIDNLWNSGDGTFALAQHVPRTILSPQAKPQSPSGSINGGRSRAEIGLVVRQNLQALRYAYTQHLRNKPSLCGKILVKFAIDEFGRVIFCEIMATTMHDGAFERQVGDAVRRWVFEKIDKPGDVTEVLYPFVFSM